MGSDSGSSGDSHKGHAFLHDFCMSIPYGAIAVFAGVALYVLGLTDLAGVAVVSGGTCAMASVLSLKEWKAGGSSTTYTLTSAGA